MAAPTRYSGVAFNASGFSTTAGGSVDIGSDSDTVVILHGGENVTGTTTIVGATCNGVAMTLVNSGTRSSTGGDVGTFVITSDSAIGSGSVTLTLTMSDSNKKPGCVVEVWHGCSGSPRYTVGTPQLLASGSTSKSAGPYTSDADSMVEVFMSIDGAIIPVATSPTLLGASTATSTLATDAAMYKAGATSVTLNWTHNTTSSNYIVPLQVHGGAADTTAPLITGPSGAAGDSTSVASIPENTTAVHTFTADESVTWDLNGGADVALFTINSSTGALAFSSAPNYESPADADTNNTYVVGVRATDAATNAATQTVTITITDADEVSPTLTSLTASSATPLTCQGSVSTNEATGTLYTVFTASATAPSAAQVKLGQDHTGSAALRAVSQAVSGTGSQSIASGSVTAGTRYAHCMHEDAATNQSTVASSASFTVAASYSVTTDALKDASGTVRTSYSVAKVYAIRLSDNTLVKTWTSQTTDGSGQLALSDAALTAAPHAFVTVSSDNKAGVKVYTPA